jgi:UDP-glucose:glycoprotein glucosyltransferase
MIKFLRVMMQSVLANTKNPVKFWFLKNYLSPKFINSVPTIAKELGCEVNVIICTDFDGLTFFHSIKE